MLIMFSHQTLLEKWWEGIEKKEERRGRERGRREGRGLDDIFIITCHSQFHASLWLLGGGCDPGGWDRGEGQG